MVPKAFESGAEFGSARHPWSHIMRIVILPAYIAVLLALSACGHSATTRAATGGLGGAAVGTVVGGPVLGTAAGAVTGATVGAATAGH